MMQKQRVLGMTIALVALLLGLIGSGGAVENGLSQTRGPAVSVGIQQAGEKPSDKAAAPVAKYANDMVLVGFKNGVSVAASDSVHAAVGARLVHSYNNIPVDVVAPPAGMSVEQAIGAYESRAEVAYAEPNYELHALATPNDTRFAELWAMNNTGQTGGTTDADIDAPEAWDVATGNSSVVVGVIDTGVDYTHEDLAANMWTNSGELGGTPAFDDDGNGIIDDIYGARWTDGSGAVTSGNPMDGHGHGTHCSGTIGGVGNNGTGVAGVNWTVRIMALKFLSDAGSGSTADAISALDYAIDMGAHLTSNSWGGGSFSQALKDMIDAAAADNQLFIAAAGNDGLNTDISPHYPSSYSSANIVSVASSDHNDARSSFSNYGVTSVDLAAPGSSIVSCAPGNSYQSMSGTSMATPHVSGVAALILSQHLGTAQQTLKNWILQGATPLAAWDGVTLTGTRLNAAEGLRVAGLPAYAEPVGSFTATSDSDTIDLAWTNPADAHFVQVIVRRGSSQYPNRWDQGDAVYNGTDTSFEDGPLTSGETYYYSIWAEYSGSTYYSALRTAKCTVSVSLRPPTPDSPLPADGAQGVPADTLLSWNNVPTPTPTPTPSPGYYEDFNDGLAQDWSAVVGSDWAVVSNEYRATAPSVERWMQSGYTGLTWTNCAYQATLRREGDRSYTSAMFVRASNDFNVQTPAGSAYGVGIADLDGVGYFWVIKWVSGTDTWLTGSWATSGYLHTDGTPDVVMINMDGSTIEVYFNGNLAWSGTDASVAGPGRVGLGAYSLASSGTSHFFDDLSVTNPLPFAGAAALSPEQAWYNAHPCQGEATPSAAPADARPPVYPGDSGGVGQPFAVGAHRELVPATALNMANVEDVAGAAIYRGGPIAVKAVPNGTTVDFPSNDSTVVSSTGFIDDDEIGWFWSVARGDSVTETFSTSEASITGAVFDFVVPYNCLSGSNVDWNVLINGTVVGSFTVVPGQTGAVHLDLSFPAISGPGYTVRFEVTNEVPSGYGSITLGYAGASAGTVQLGGGVDVTYDVYLRRVGASTWNHIYSGPDTSCPPVPSPLYMRTDYEWYVVATNDEGSTTGPTWTFKTQGGRLRALLAPPEAVAGGAMWRTVGTGKPWRASGYVETLVPDTYSVRFKPIAGYSTPPNQSGLAVVDYLLTTVNATYQPGIQVTINPAGAVAAGARWRLVGTGRPWRPSGYVEIGLAAGDYQIRFKDLPGTGWQTPARQTVTFVPGTPLLASGTYTAGLTSVILPPEAIAAGAMWRIVGIGGWTPSGVVKTGLAAGSYTVRFRAAAGYTTPSNQTAAFTAGTPLVFTGTYVATILSGENTP